MAYVAHGERTENGVGKRVERHVGVAVAEEAACVGDVHAADDAAPAFDKAVHVESVSYAYVCYVHRVICVRKCL